PSDPLTRARVIKHPCQAVGLTRSEVAFRHPSVTLSGMDRRRMRVSDSERERVAQFLRDQSLEGRLDHEELEERLGEAYAAKTAGQLEDLIEDLPHRRVPAAPARPPAPPVPPQPR